jgi:tripartite-type tricarboxylate transporter receptor subunit TctC
VPKDVDGRDKPGHDGEDAADTQGNEAIMSGLITHLCCILAALAIVPATSAGAQDAYPTRPIKLVVGFVAGGSTDVPARYIADKLSDRVGQRVVVENKPAAAGMIATRDVLSQPRDGYTLLLCTHFESINSAVYRNPQYQLADIAPISLISKYFYGITIANSVPATDLASFIAYAKAHPGEISYATLGPGSAQEIFARQLERLAGISMNRVPYRGGAQIVQDLLPGRVHFYVSPTISVLPLLENQQAKILAVSSPERIKAAPQVPTLKEQGIDFVRFGWLGICAGAGTPQPVIDLINRHIRAIVATPEYQAVTEKAGSVPVSSTPQELRQVIEQTRTDVEATIKEFGLQQD